MKGHEICSSAAPRGKSVRLEADLKIQRLCWLNCHRMRDEMILAQLGRISPSLRAHLYKSKLVSNSSF